MKTLCPICSNILLRHLDRRKVLWLCLRCRQEMPNFDLVMLNAISKKLPKSCDRLDIHEKNNLKSQIDAISQVILCKPKIIDLFILNKIDMILFNTFINSEQYITSKQERSPEMEPQSAKTSNLTKANFLRDSEIILLYICQAILVADNTILNKIEIQELKVSLISLKLPVEQSYFIDLIKTLVIDFIYSIARDYPQGVDYFASEVASYFDLVITLMIKPSKSTTMM